MVNDLLVRRRTVGEEFAARSLGILLAARIAVDAAIDGPFGKHRRSRFEVAWFPVRIELVFVGVILDQATGRILKYQK